MAEVLAFLKRSLDYITGWYLRRLDLSATSPLLSQPLDILFLILESLPPESAVALSLTCKSAFHAFFPAAGRRLDAKSRQHLLEWLERSVSRSHYFCHSCTQLHRFSSSWKPSLDCILTCTYHGPPCRSDLVWFGGLQVGFHLVRLVMNAHLFGPGRGLRLCQLEIQKQRCLGHWETNSVARVLDGQLYL
jgi:hypothetical protein